MFCEDFLKCGIAGWCIEVLWTGWCSCLSHNLSMTATTSLLMFPIYGLAALIRPLYAKIKGLPVILRGLIYMICIFLIEYTTGSVLQYLHICPWNYNSSKYNINGLIRLDYAPCWFVVGLFFEKLLNPVQSGSHADKQQVKNC